MTLRVIVRECDTSGSGPAWVTFKTFDIPMTPELIGHLCSLPKPPHPIQRAVIGAEVVE